MYGLYNKHGRIVFQLYAGYGGCNFTKIRAGISSIRINWFISLVNGIDGTLTTGSLAASLWLNQEDVAWRTGFQSVSNPKARLQHLVDIYSRGKIYNDKSRMIDISVNIHVSASSESVGHMNGKQHSRTQSAFNPLAEIRKLDCSELLHQTAADSSNTCRVNRPAGKNPEQCIVAQLRSYFAAQGGTITMNKPS